MTLKSGWLKCDIKEGMFPDERSVFCSSADNTDFSFFARPEIIDKNNQHIKVHLIESLDDAYLVLLPTMPFEINSRTVKVAKDDLVEETV